MSLYDEIVDASMNSSDFPGLFDEAFTRMIDDMKVAALTGKTEFRWMGSMYPSVKGETDDKLLANWLVKEGFIVSFIQNSDPRVWICRWDPNEKIEDEDEDEDEE